MDPHPLSEVLKLVVLPMARSYRIGGIRTMIFRAWNLLLGLLTAKLERAVLDPHFWFTPGCNVPVAALRLASSRLTQHYEC